MCVQRALVDHTHVDRALVQLLHPELLPPLESLDDTVDSVLCLLTRLIENMFPKPDIEIYLVGEVNNYLSNNKPGDIFITRPQPLQIVCQNVGRS